ncbi:hypothetical protein KBZ07_09320 [Cyanobium sp. BA20m-14]|nr:hypothetical protein [Cyanobium sp. BA20m-14]MCP9913603.1 hypothetical protein [Cyanobium sp. BA20m-14]
MGLIHGTVQLCIPEHIAIQLRLRELGSRGGSSQRLRDDELGWRSK